MFKEIQEAFKYRFVIQNYVYSNLKLKYRRSLLGYLWAVIAPMFRYLVIGIVFFYIAKMRDPHYFGFMFMGSIFYSYMSVVLMTSSNVFIQNEMYIKKIYVPKLVFVLNIVFFEMVNFALVLIGIILLGLIFNQFQLSLYMFMMIYAVIITTFFLIGWSAILGVMTIYFRDLTHMLDIVLQAVYFATPILYSINILPKTFANLVKLNPFYYFVELFRVPVLQKMLPDPDILLVTFGLSFLSFFLGLFILKKFNNRIVFKL